MSNDYFNHPNPVVRHTRGRASAVNAIWSAIASAFDLLPGRDDLIRGRITYAADTGAANGLVVALPKSLTAYQDGTFIRVKVNATNTGAATINVDSLGTRNIKAIDGTDLLAGDLTAGDYAELTCDESNTRWLLTGYWRTALSRATQAAADAEAALDAFDDIFLGSKSTAPTVDNDGDPLVEGQLYWNSVSKNLFINNGSSWVDAAFSAEDYAALAGATFTGNLSVTTVDEDVDTLSGTTPTLDVSAAQHFTLTTSGNTTFTVSNAPSGRAWTRTITITGAGAHTINITSADWGDAGVPDVLASGDIIKIVLDGVGTSFTAAEVFRATA